MLTGVTSTGRLDARTRRTVPGRAGRSLVNVGSVARHDPDATLVHALRRHDGSAAEQLVERYGDRLYAMAVRLTGSHTAAAEAVQEALGTATRTIDGFDGESPFAAWVALLVSRAAYQRLLARWTGEDTVPDDVLPAIGADGHFGALDDWSRRLDERAADGDLQDVLAESIATLPPDHRAALVLSDVEGMARHDIATVLGLETGQVTSRVHRARLVVRKRLSDHLAGAG
jgi:RNA polymerase sigma-70 factor (ECF subfamily)